MKSNEISLNKELFVGKVEGSITDFYQIIKVDNIPFNIFKGNRIRQLRKSLQS